MSEKKDKEEIFKIADKIEKDTEKAIMQNKKKLLPDLPHKNIVIVDDDPDFILFMENLLNQIGNFTITNFKDEIEGLQSVVKDSPDLIIMDIMLANSDGMKLGSTMRQFMEFEAPILFVSSNKSYEQDVNMLMDNYDRIDFISKPFDKKRLADKIKEILSY